MKVHEQIMKRGGRPLSPLEEVTVPEEHQAIDTALRRFTKNVSFNSETLIWQGIYVLPKKKNQKKNITIQFILSKSSDFPHSHNKPIYILRATETDKGTLKSLWQALKNEQLDVRLKAAMFAI